MVLGLYIALVCYMPILEVFLPRTNFGRGIPDIGPVRLISYLLLLVFILEAAIKHKIKLFSKWPVILGIYSVIVLASVSWSSYSYSVDVIQYIVDRVFMPLFVAIIAVNVFKERKNAFSYVRNIMIACSILSIMSIYQVLSGATTFTGVVRAAATLGNPNALAILLVLSIPCIIYGIEKRLFNKKAGWLICALVIGGIICTVSRKGIATGTLGFFLYFYLKRQYKKIMSFGLMVVILTFIFAGYSVISGRFGREKFDRDIEQKWSMTYAGLKMFHKSPIIGLGYKGYYKNVRIRDRRNFDAHNIFITALTNYGLIGFIPFMGIFLYPLFVSRRIIRSNDKKNSNEDARAMAIICICSIVPFMINGYFAGGGFYKAEILFILYSNTALVFACSQHLEKSGVAIAKLDK